jgi:hypothetical protein
MDKKRTITLKLYSQEQAIRAGDFSLMPVVVEAPFIISQPIKNFIQYTWIEGVQDGVPAYQSIKPTSNTINILEGTEFSFGLKTVDPSNVNDSNSTENLSYRWKKDESQIYELNRLKDGVGTDAIFINSANSKIALSGRYTCEVTNRYGTVESDPIDINIIDPLKHPKIYKNLLLNGDGEGGLEGWQGDTDIKVIPFLNNALLTNNFGSFKLGSIIVLPKDWTETTDRDESQTEPIIQPPEFYFSLGSHSTLFFEYYWKRYQRDPTFKNINVKSKSSSVLNSSEMWVSEGLLPNIVANEDLGRTEFAGFFPGVGWLDFYNKNNLNVIGLYSELKDYTPTYFGRDRIKFVKFGGKANATMTQTVDLTSASDIIDGSVYGIKYSTSQFFAYIGAGITNYKVTMTTAEGVKTFNYGLADSEIWYDRIFVLKNRSFPEVRDNDLGFQRYVPIVGTPIEITPIVNDKTSVTLDYIDDSGKILKTETINGPDETDVWAIKEKVFFPLTLLPIFLFVSLTGNNPITVFGQEYTNTNKLSPLFDNFNGADILGDFNKTIPTTLTDVNAKFLLNKYNFKSQGATNFAPYGSNYSYKDKSLEEYGAAAMFGVGKNIIIPFKTRTVNITVNFTHTSDIINDSNPEIKGWTSQDIYSDELGQNTGVSQKLTEYGAPRCGITKMKFLIAPNDIQVSDKYVTYQLPPATSTVLGLQKKRYNVPDSFNSGNKVDFKYTLVQPVTPPVAPRTTSPFILSKNLASYIESLNQSVLKDKNNNPTTVEVIEPNMDISDSLASQEDLDYNNELN